MNWVLLTIAMTLSAASALSEETAIEPREPRRPCELISQSGSPEGRPVVVVGRFSFRETGRSIGEAKCVGSQGVVLEVHYDAEKGPKPPDAFSIDERAIRRQLSAVKQTTALQKFRFGTVEYDKWAMVYGKIEKVPNSEQSDKTAKDSAGLRLVVRSETYVIFLVE